MTYNPQPKPVKKEKETLTSFEFRKKYGSKSISTEKCKGLRMNPFPKKKRFYDYPAWTWFSRYIKLLHCEAVTGIVKCATSGALFHVSSPSLHAGHCIKVYDSNSTNFSVAFDHRNVLPQSGKDNVYSGGKPEVMRDKIDLLYGEGTYQDLLNQSKQVKFYSEGDLKAKAILYRNLCYELLAEKNIKKWW